jgi:CBS domain-containing protein
MTVKSILDEKGRDVVTLAPEATLAAAASLLAERRIGAVVVTDGSSRILGILSERDIVRAVGMAGAAALDMPASAMMTARMTHGRFRHLPVEKDGRLDGIVSLGDVVKRRIEMVEREADQIREYIATA